MISTDLILNIVCLAVGISCVVVIFGMLLSMVRTLEKENDETK